VEENSGVHAFVGSGSGISDLWAIIRDPLHQFKRIRYHLLKLSSFLSPDERTDFSIDRTQQGHFLSLPVFNKSKSSKMHCSLLLDLFSLKTLSYILFPGNHVVGDVMIAPWCLLVSALTLSDISTQMRIELLEIAFGMPLIYAGPIETVVGDPARSLGSLFF
jgi:hypothetical protein